MYFAVDNLQIYLIFSKCKVNMEINMRAEKFKNLAEKRVNSAMKQIQLIGNLANPSSYEYEEAQVSKIFKTLRKELESAELKFKARPQEGGMSFTL